MVLQLDGRISAGNDLLDADLRDIHIVSGPGGTFLYAATGQNGGISVYRVDGAGGLAGLSDTSYFSNSGITMGWFDVITLDGTARLILGGTGNGQLIGYGFQGDGDLTGVQQIDLPGTGVETAGAMVGKALGSGMSALYMVEANTGTLRGYISDGTGGISATAALNGKAAAYQLDAAVALDTAQAGGVSFLLAADATTGSVRSYRINTDTGTLKYIDSLGAENGLGVALPSAMQTVRAHGTTWVILAASGSGTLSVMKLSPNGQLEPADHILDTLATRFGGVAALEVIKVDGHVFVLAGGADDGLSLFSLLPDGRLVHMQSLAHTAGAGLENITGIEAVQVGDEIRIFVTSGSALGVSQFSLPLGDLGSIIQSSGGGAQVLGTGAGDLILGRDGRDRLMGRDGDDILVTAAGGGVLSGGAGADIFVLCPTTGRLEISDFEPGQDRLDLTQFPMLRSVAQLDLTPTSTGIEIRFGTTLIVIRSSDGNTLTASDLWPAGFDTPDRVLIPSGPVVRVTRGTDADDTLTLGLGQDTIWGLDGNDTIRGGIGNDRVFGGTGADKIFGGQGKDTLKGGKGYDTIRGAAGDDTIRGEIGNDKVHGQDGQDRLFGGDGTDRLFGGKGKDNLEGGKDDDILNGGAGDDTLRGGRDGDILRGGAGNDVLKGEIGKDVLIGGDGRDVLKGGAGHDDLSGGDGRDVLKGEAGRDALKGGDKADTLLGGRGNDKLTGGKGADMLTGGAGRDVFIFGTGGGKGHGDDRITDFTSGQDHIRIAVGGVGFADLSLTRQPGDTGFDTLIDTGHGTITLTGLRPKDLSADDFLFS